MLIDPKSLSTAHRYYVAAIILFIIWSTLYLNGSIRRDHVLLNSARVSTYLSHLRTGKSPDDGSERRAELENAVYTMFKSIKIDPTKRFYRDSRGHFYFGSSTNNATWTEPLGKKILVVDIDTRVPDGDNQVLSPNGQNGMPIDWETLQASGNGLVSHAITNHYLYAMIHGYEYRYYQALNVKDHYPTWIQPHILKELLPDFQFIITMDADVVISHLEVPVEWMFNRWDIAKHTSMALPHDTEEFVDGKSISTDSKGVPVLNTGFVVTHNLPKTFEILDAWGNCTTEKRYPGCARWKHEWSHEQRAFSEYIRYDFGKVPQTIVGIPCDDAVGYPNFKKYNEDKGNAGISDCNGNFIRHYTLGKDQVHAGATNTMMQALAEVLQKSLLNQQDDYVIKEQEPTTVPWENAARVREPWEKQIDRPKHKGPEEEDEFFDDE